VENEMDELRKNLVERVGLAEDRAEAAIKEVLAYLNEHLPEPAATLVAEFAASHDDPEGPDRTKQVTTAAMAATTAAVNAVVLPGAC
jgi:hypothetical protein